MCLSLRRYTEEDERLNRLLHMYNRAEDGDPSDMVRRCRLTSG